MKHILALVSEKEVQHMIHHWMVELNRWSDEEPDLKAEAMEQVAFWTSKKESLEEIFPR